MFLKQIKKIQQIIKEHYLIILIIVLGIILRSLCLKQSLWTDEACSIVLAKNSFNDLIKFTKLDLHPPVYFIILHFWIYFFGDGIKAVRVLSMII